MSILLFTAGTAGKPKGVLLTHSQFIRVFSKVCDRFDSGEILKGIETHKITMFAGTPAMYYMLLNHDGFDENKVKSMRVGDIAGAPVTPEMIREVSRKFGMYLFGMYGSTETSGAITLSEKDDTVELVANTVGRNFNAGCETKIVNPKTREDLPPGLVGEIVTRGWHVTQGYYKDLELFAQAKDKEGWFLTGDLGSMDEQGYVTFKGRIKELIISGGIFFLRWLVD